MIYFVHQITFYSCRWAKSHLLGIGTGDSSVVRAPDWRSKGCGFESQQEQWENFHLQGQLSVLTLISVQACMMMMIMMSNFIAHDSINLNAQCTEHVCVCLCWGAGTWCLMTNLCMFILCVLMSAVLFNLSMKCMHLGLIWGWVL